MKIEDIKVFSRQKKPTQSKRMLVESVGGMVESVEAG